MATGSCLVCGAVLTGKQTVSCSRRCTTRRQNTSPAYRATKRRYRARGGETHTVTCAHCGEQIQATRAGVRYCPDGCWHLARSEAARQRRMPVLHLDPSPVTHLPAKHPAMQPAPRPTVWWKMLVAGPCQWCAEPFVAPAASYETRSRYCSKRCRSIAGRVHRGRFAVPPAVRLAIYERDAWTCQLCWEPVDPDLPPTDNWAATLDHVVPQSWTLVPDHRPENLQLAHRWCNSIRGDETYYTVDVLVAS